MRTFGFPEIRRNDGLCQLALREGLALLIYLAEATGSVGREVLATMFWPESAEEIVRARLRRLLHRLQLTLGEDVLTTDRSTVSWSLAIDLQVDSQLFEQACDRGDFEHEWRDQYRHRASKRSTDLARPVVEDAPADLLCEVIPDHEPFAIRERQRSRQGAGESVLGTKPDRAEKIGRPWRCASSGAEVVPALASERKNADCGHWTTQ